MHVGMKPSKTTQTNGQPGPYITFSTWGGAMSFVNTKLFTLGGSGGMLPQEIFDDFRCSEVHSGQSEACREAHRAS